MKTKAKALITIAALALAGCAAKLARPFPLVEYVEAPARAEPVTATEATRKGLVKAFASTVLVFAKIEQSIPDGTIEGAVGSGVIVVKTEGFGAILTAYHVVDDAGASFKVRFKSGRVLDATIDSVDEKHDLALLVVSGKFDDPAIVVAKNPPAFLSEVWSMGAPEGLDGYVGGAGRWAGLVESSTTHYVLRKVSGGFIWAGMSGGPTVDAAGELVGINESAMTVDPRAEPTVYIPQMAFVVDVLDVRNFLAFVGALR